MLENLTAIPLGNVAVASAVTAIEKQNFDRESISEDSFKHMFNKDFSVDYRLKKNAQLGRLGESQTALLNIDFKQLSEKLQATIAQLEDGKTMPASGNSLPVLPPEVGQLLHKIKQNLDAIRLEQSNDFSVQALPTELTNLLDQLAEMAGRLNAIFDQVSMDEVTVDGVALIAEEMPHANKPDAVLSLSKVSDMAAKDNHGQMNFALSPRQFDSTLLDQNTQQQMLDEHTLQQLSALSDFIQNIQALIPDRAANLGAEFVLESKTAIPLGAEKVTASNSAQGALLDSMIRRLEHVLSRIETVAAQQKNDAEGLSPMLANAMSLNSQASSAATDIQRNAQALSFSSAAQNTASIEAFSPQLLALTNAAQNPIQPLASPVNELATQLSAQIQDTSFNLNTAVNHSGTAQAGSTFVSQPPLPTTQPSAASVAQPFATQVGLPMNNTQWGDQFVQRVAWLAGQGINSAEIQLNPAELGPLQVRIDSHEDRARVVFTAHNVSARDSIENNLPRLRDLFASQGLDLLEVDVESQQNKHGDDEGVGDEGNQQPMAEEGDLAVEGLDLASSVNGAADSPIVKSLVLNYGRVDAFV